MRHKNSWGLFLLTISIALFLISFNPTISGGVIDINTGISLSFIIGLVFFILSLVILASRQTLDAILIPTGDLSPDLKRTKRAYKEGEERKDQVYMILGNLDQPLNKSEVYRIYKQLRSHEIPPSKIRIEGKSKTTLENVLFSLEKLKKMGAHDVGIASYGTHLNRFEYLIDKAKEEGLVDKDFKVHRLEVPETWGEHIYGVVSNLLYRYELRKGLHNAERPWFHGPIKKVISYFAEKAKEKQK
ncbi:MAG: ElyC/SanA/YdcF family protein [Nanoarchaeota archaeon]|nr:ElyC/SanA/YdcF family protein [Nanoarchaeota archaeon]